MSLDRNLTHWWGKGGQDASGYAGDITLPVPAEVTRSLADIARLRADVRPAAFHSYYRGLFAQVLADRLQLIGAPDFQTRVLEQRIQARDAIIRVLQTGYQRNAGYPNLPSPGVPDLAVMKLEPLKPLTVVKRSKKRFAKEVASKGTMRRRAMELAGAELPEEEKKPDDAAAQADEKAKIEAESKKKEGEADKKKDDATDEKKGGKEKKAA
ncbi:MAG: hypothetical protein WCG83_02780 [Candidatus Peregrinibacteria bacterium]